MEELLEQIKHMLKNGQAWEARELFFDEIVPWLITLNDTVNSLIADPRPTPDMEAVWESMRKRLTT